MHIVGVRLINWTRFRGTFVLALKAGVYAVTARSDENERASNWLGKSAFLAAIRWALDTSEKVLDKDVLDELITDGEDEMAVELEFSDGTFISRTKKRGKHSVQTFLALPDGRTPTQEGAQTELDALIAIGSKDRLTTCFSEQRELASLVRMTSAPTTQMFERWVGVELLVEAGELAAGWFAEKSAEHLKVHAEQTQLADLADEATVAAVRDEIAKEVLRCDALDVAYEKAKTEAASHGRRYRLAQLKEDEAELLADLVESEDPPRAPEGDREVLDKAERAAGQVYGENNLIFNRALAVVKDRFAGDCPVSAGFKCPATAQINERVEENRKAAEDARSDRNAAEAAVNLARVNVREWNAQKNAFDAYERARADLTARLEVVRRRMADPEFQGVSAIAKGPDGRLPDAPSIPDPADRTRLNELRKELDRREAALPRLEDARQRLARLKDELAAYRAAVAVLGQEGARRRVVERVVSRVVSDANAKLARAGIDLSVRAEWGRDTGKPAEHCAECGAAFPASARVKECERCQAPRGTKIKHEFRFRLSNVSGAAEDLAGLALREAAFGWLCERRGAPWSVAQLDEPLAQLDEANKEAVAASLQRLLSGTYEQAFVTAHDRGVLDAMPNRILITGYGKDSKIEVIG